MSLLTFAAWLLYGLCSALAFEQNNLEFAVSALRPQLSEGAVITFPWDTRWDELQLRASSPQLSPDYSVVIEVATESDVQITVTLANRFNIPFLAVSGGHGWTMTLEKLPYGIQINMRKLNTTTLSPDGKIATVGGGTLQYEITRSLFAHGKYTVTGVCVCVSVAGPLLGGGHSFLQGQYGYSLDNLVSARVVLASGKLVEASRTKNSDLFWALQGAGHNFGILTSLEVKAHDILSKWTVYSLLFPTNKLEPLFNLVNKFEEPTMERPAELVFTGAFIRIPSVNLVNPVVAYTVAYEGTEEGAEPYAAQFIALGPLSVTVSTDVDYAEIYDLTGTGLDSPPCKRNRNLVGNGISLPRWDLEGLRVAFTVFGDLTADARFTSSLVLLENYGMQGVRDVDSDSTALPVEEREYPILACPVIWWDGNDKQTTEDANAYAGRIRDALYTDFDKGDRKRHTYVNYANGVESKPEIYGYDSRLAKLAQLKKKWDPKNRFGYYNPVL